MESNAARKIEEKTPQEKIKEVLQKILTAMNDYIRANPEAVKSPTSDRLLSIKKIATAIYDYYRQPSLLLDFESNLNDFFTFIDDVALHKKSFDSSHLKLLPELKEIYKSDVLPRSFHTFYAIIGLIQNDIKSMRSWRGRSGLSDNLVSAISGYDAITQALATNVYLTVFSEDLIFAEILRRPVDFANYLYEALTTSRVYSEGNPAVTFNGTSKSYHVIFTASKDDAVKTIARDYEGAGCFGVEFSFTLRKSASDEVGQYIPLLASVQQMDIWQDTKAAKCSNAFALECHASKPEFVIARHQPTASLKK